MMISRLGRQVVASSRTLATARPFKVLGVQQIAVGGLDKVSVWVVSRAGTNDATDTIATSGTSDAHMHARTQPQPHTAAHSSTATLSRTQPHSRA